MTPTHPHVGTLRLLLTLDCNLSCDYCCNELPAINTHFQEKSLEKIVWDGYDNICLTGGEPFKAREQLYAILDLIPDEIPLYLYTNGLLVTFDDVMQLMTYPNLAGINVGLHTVPQARFLHTGLSYLPVRYHIEESKVQAMQQAHPWLVDELIHPWTRDNCTMPNEDWVLLTKKGQIHGT